MGTQPRQFKGATPARCGSHGSSLFSLPLLAALPDLTQVLHGHLLTIKRDGLALQDRHFRFGITADHVLNIIEIHTQPPDDDDHADSRAGFVALGSDTGGFATGGGATGGASGDGSTTR